MHKPALALVCVSLFFACQRPPEQPATDKPASAALATTTSTATIEEPASPPVIYFVDNQLWRIDLDGSNPQPLGLKLSPENPEMDQTIGHGESTPTISHDGRRLAWIDDVNLVVTELGPSGPSNHQITNMPPRADWIMAASISFSTWSPDSSTLIVSLSEPGYEEEIPLPLPAGTTYGFHVLRAADRTLVPAPHIEGVYGWTADSKAVLDNKFINVSNYELVAYPIEPGPAKQLRTATDAYGFSQLNVMGDWLTWSSSLGGSRVLVAPIAGGEPKPMSPQAGFADIQWPMVAPDGAHVTYLAGQFQLAADTSVPTPLPTVHELQWFDAEHLIAITHQGLTRVDLDGSTTPLDPAGTHLVRR